MTPGMVYGIRRYLQGASLSLHVDRLDTHVVSAILQLDQEVEKAWPLMLIDHKVIHIVRSNTNKSQ